MSWRSVAKRRARRAAAAPATPPGLLPRDVARLYGIDAVHALGYHGEGERIGFVEVASPNARDDAAFWAAASLEPALNTPVRTVAIGGASGDPGGLAEADLDLQYAGALAPGATLTAYVISGQGTTGDFLGQIYDALWQASLDGVRVVSISLGTAEGLLPQAAVIRSRLTGRRWSGFGIFSAALDEMVRSRGLLVFVAAGDSGAYGGLPFLQMAPQAIWPAIQPSMIAVGGTQLATPGDVTSGERAWGGQTVLGWLPAHSDSNTCSLASGGGGVSRLIAAPSYQSALGFSGRATPDIAAFAGPLAILDQGAWMAVWGTSAAAPISAAAAVLVHQVAGRWLRHADLYAHARDIVAGNDWNNELMFLLRLTRHTAAAGYDLCTGAGAPDLRPLVG